MDMEASFTTVDDTMVIKQDPDHDHFEAEPSPAYSHSPIAEESAMGRNTPHPPTPRPENSTMNGLAGGPFHRSEAPPPSTRIGRSEEPGPLLLQTRGVPGMPKITLPFREDQFTNSFRDIGQKLKACNDTLGELHQLGVDHDIHLPELVLVGDQSAGKSSLMSGLANLELPRSEGACTRCPIHIRLSRNTEWSCRVRLERDWAYCPTNGGLITEDMVTERNMFPPWVKQPRVSHDFKTGISADKIDDVLRWAQIAILNDGQNYNKFVPGSGSIALHSTLEEAALKTDAKFSPNIVSLAIQGPDFPDLSFYDMPGIFHSATDEKDQYLAKVVEYLTMEYVGHPEAIIICALPMNNDAELSSSFSILRKMRALPRTIGVLTKADLLPKGGDQSQNHNKWLQILEGKAYNIGQGYFITSRPTDKSLEDLKKWEDHFFDTKQGYECEWPEAFHKFQDKCGIETLRDFLSKRLGEAFAQKLPSIKQKVIEKLNDVNANLGKLPELPQNVQHEVEKSLYEFATIARASLGEGKEFFKQYSELPEEFLHFLLQIKPTFIFKHPIDERPKVIEIMDTSDSDQRSTNTVFSTPSKRGRVAGQVNPPSGGASAKRRRTTVAANGQTVQPTVSNIKLERERDGSAASSRNRGDPPPPAPRPESPFKGLKRKQGALKLEELRKQIASKSRPGMPGVIPQEIYEDLCKNAVSSWPPPTKRFLNVTRERLEKVVVDRLEASMENLKNRLIFKESFRHLADFIQEQALEIEKFQDKLYRLESHKLFTVNEKAFETYRLEEANDLEAYRHHMRWEAHTDEKSEFKPPSKMQDDQRRKYETARDSQLKQLGPDSFQNELLVASYVRGYYRLAAHRYADTISQTITSMLIPDVIDGLALCLRERLGLFTADTSRYEELMEEDGDTAKRRETLKSEKLKFERALESIQALEQRPGDTVVDDSVRLDLAMESHSTVCADESMDVEY